MNRKRIEHQEKHSPLISSVVQFLPIFLMKNVNMRAIILPQIFTE
jgi:hypothetical protein